MLLHVKLLKAKGLTIATAESCTGGLLSERITSVSGASDVFELGICSYSCRIKNEILGVDTDVIEKYGVVSSETALEMVRGIKRISSADVCVSVTGIAGPSGGTPEQPVGTVYIGFDICGKQFVKLPELWELDNGTRERIRLAAAAFAFEYTRLGIFAQTLCLECAKHRSRQRCGKYAEQSADIRRG